MRSSQRFLPRASRIGREEKSSSQVLAFGACRAGSAAVAAPLRSTPDVEASSGLASTVSALHTSLSARWRRSKAAHRLLRAAGGAAATRCLRARSLGGNLLHEQLCSDGEASGACIVDGLNARQDVKHTPVNHRLRSKLGSSGLQLDATSSASTACCAWMDRGRAAGPEKGHPMLLARDAKLSQERSRGGAVHSSLLVLPLWKASSPIASLEQQACSACPLVKGSQPADRHPRELAGAVVGRVRRRPKRELPMELPWPGSCTCPWLTACVMTQAGFPASSVAAKKLAKNNSATHCCNARSRRPRGSGRLWARSQSTRAPVHCSGWPTWR